MPNAPSVTFPKNSFWAKHPGLARLTGFLIGLTAFAGVCAFSWWNDNPSDSTLTDQLVQIYGRHCPDSGVTWYDKWTKQYHCGNVMQDGSYKVTKTLSGPLD